MSKLALLAKQRLEGKSKGLAGLSLADSATRLPSKLSLLAKSREGKGILGGALNVSDKPSLGPKLIKKKGVLPTSVPKVAAPIELPSVVESSQTRRRRRIRPSSSENREKGSESISKDPPSATAQEPSPMDELLRVLLTVETRSLQNKPICETSVALLSTKRAYPNVEESQNKLRKLADNIFLAFTNNDPNIAKAKANFNRPSPDDKVLEAQKQAFELDLKKLSLKEGTVEKRSGTATPVITETKPFVKLDLATELSKYVQPHKSFVVIGHVDAGKSTLMGRILYDTGTVDAKTVNKLVREAEKSGKGSFALAWLLDQTTEERSRGVTIDICSTTFKTDNIIFTAIDAPGHKDFVPQMISGVSQADIALLVVDSINGEFEAGFVMDGQTKEHTLLAKSLGIEQVCIAINKLDKEDWSQARFEDIKTQLTLFLTSKDVGFHEEKLHFVPISGLSGTNVVKNDRSTPEFAWYNGPTLIGCLEDIKIPESHISSLDELLSEELNLSIGEIVEILSSEFRVQGKVSLGMIQAGETVRFNPTNDCLQVQALSVQAKGEPVAVRGQIVQLSFKTGQLKNKSIDDLAVGDLILNLESAVRLVSSFEASIVTFHMDKPLLVGTPFVLFRNNASVSARISKIILIANSKRKKMHLVSQQEAKVEIEIVGDRLFPVAEFSKNKALGRVVLRKEGATIAAGTVQSLQNVA
ncbi:hypothetical protein PUMCH_003300 [Australozyma saopauloensis]|uniref:Elongation factor 1 alpha-like protein n=1 Tax=Australozyma saopauloensis TaxID=291208 RepID=A0AAX4HBJ2_9ASCO|nr:hypothetical protein PUMCH_003300 [[Candida] saopauloensis]